jgi:hypothetical protein
VQTDSTILFEYYPSDDENLLISLTARTGDPDLYIATGDRVPYCRSGSYGFALCYNYTWYSRMFSTDQIFLSSDEPCTALLPSTTVSSTCNPESAYPPSMFAPVNILVQGWRDSQFSILASPTGGLRHLLAGQPQLSLATPAIICKDRTASGSCVKASTNIDKKVLLSTFSFQVSSPSSSVSASGAMPSSVGDVLITVLPKCDNASSTVCLPGCACNKLQVYATSCATSQCTVQHRHPSFMNHNFAAMISAVDEEIGSTLIMPTSGENNCDPLEAGEGCMYFISVIADYNEAPGATMVNQHQAEFTITARTPFDIALIPCGSVHAFTDGIRQDSLDYIRDGTTENARNYEICSSASAASDGSSTQSDIVVTLEQCSGSTTLYACDDHCVTPLPSSASNNWAYSADSEVTCAKRWISYGTSSGWGKAVCTSSHDSVASLTLPASPSNYFLTAEGTGKYRFQVESLSSNGNRLAPSVVPFGGHAGGDWDGNVHLFEPSDGSSAVIGNTVKLTWMQSQVLLPQGRVSVPADYMAYHAYVLDIGALSSELARVAVGDVPVFRTVCGLENILDLSGEMPKDRRFAQKIMFKSRPSDLNKQTTTRRLAKLFPLRVVNITIVAVCDGVCLHMVSKSQGRSDACLKDTDCHPQYLVYPPFAVMTGEAPSENADTGGPGTSNMSSSTVATVVYISISVVTALIVVLGLFWMTYARRNAHNNDDLDGIQLQDYSTSVDTGKGKGGDAEDIPQRYEPPIAFGALDDGDDVFGSQHNQASNANKMKRIVGNVGQHMMGAVNAIGAATTRVALAAGAGQSKPSALNRMSRGKAVVKGGKVTKIQSTAYSPLSGTSSHAGDGDEVEDYDDEEVTVQL